MTDPALEPDEKPTRAEMLAELAWIVGPLASLWVTIDVVKKLFPDWPPLLQAGTAVMPVAAVLYGIGFWRRRKSA